MFPLLWQQRSCLYFNLQQIVDLQHRGEDPDLQSIVTHYPNAVIYVLLMFIYRIIRSHISEAFILTHRHERWHPTYRNLGLPLFLKSALLPTSSTPLLSSTLSMIWALARLKTLKILWVLQCLPSPRQPTWSYLALREFKSSGADVTMIQEMLFHSGII